MKTLLKWFSKTASANSRVGQRETPNINALKEWTGKSHVKVIYDSTVDECTDDGLFNKVKGKPNIAVIGFTTDGDVFGGFYSVAVTEQWRKFYDPNIFAFSFESHGRCETPQRFVVKGWCRHNALVVFCRGDSWGWFVHICGGPGEFGFGDERAFTFYEHMSESYEGIGDTTLTGKKDCSDDQHCIRIVAVQLE